MRIFLAGVPARKRAKFKSDILRAIANAHDLRVKFVRSPVTEYEISVLVELEENEKLKGDLLPCICPLVDELASLKLNARCSIKRQGDKKPFAVWHRWSLNTRHSWF